MKPDNNSSLLPCPFCGNQEITIRDKSGYYGVGILSGLTVKWQISCDKCCTDISAPSEQECIKRWNTRATPTELSNNGELVDALEKIANCKKTGEWYDGRDGYQRDEYEMYSDDMVELAQKALRISKHGTVAGLDEIVQLMATDKVHHDKETWGKFQWCLTEIAYWRDKALQPHNQKGEE